MSDQHGWPRPGQPNNQQPEGSQWSTGDGQGTPTPDAPAPGDTPGAPQPPSAPEAPGAPWSQSGSDNPYVAPSSSNNPYAAPSSSNDAYGSSSQERQSPYGAPSQERQNPYGAPSQEQQAPYSAPSSSSSYEAPSNPYAAPQQQGQQYGQGAPQNPYAGPSNPYAAPSQQPYGAPQNPYAASQNPYAASQNPYGAQQNPYAGAYSTGYQPYAQRRKTNTLAILSIIFGLGGVIIYPLIILTSPAGAIMGHLALGKIKRSGEGGRGLALAGIIGGWALTALYILIVVVLVAVGTHAYNSDPYFDDGGTGAFVL